MPVSSNVTTSPIRPRRSPIESARRASSSADAEALRLGRVARQGQGERQPGDGLAGGAQQAPAQHEGLGLDLLALARSALAGGRRQQGEQAALVPVDQRPRPVDVHRGARLLQEAAHEPRVGDDAALGVRVLQLADQGDAAAATGRRPGAGRAAPATRG